jgi:NAD-dependent DNA ligase
VLQPPRTRLLPQSATYFTIPRANTQGGPKALEGKCFVVSGVLDSMSRDECAAYVKKHGGAMAKSITLKVTHVLTDHGEVGASKRKQAIAKGIPIVSEDVMFELVRASAAH